MAKIIDIHSESKQLIFLDKLPALDTEKLYLILKSKMNKPMFPHYKR